MDKKEIFKKELSYIKNVNFRKDAEYLIENLPDYFFTVPASSTGKYHPAFSLGEGGLVRHTKALVRIANDLLENPAIGSKYTSDEKDLMLIAGLIHDGLKHGNNYNKYVVFDHPLVAAEYIKSNKDKLSMDNSSLKLIVDVISSHMGPWTKDYNGKEVLPAPKTKYENFIHMCDYISAQRYLDIKFDSDNNIIG